MRIDCGRRAALRLWSGSAGRASFNLLVVAVAACKTPAPTSTMQAASEVSAATPTATQADAPNPAAIETLFARLNPKPRNYPELVNGIAGLTKAKRVELLLPKGRSVQKDNVSVVEPRIIAAFHNPEQHQPPWPIPDVDHRLFIGYSAKAKQAEVISWDQDQQRFEFYRIEKLGDGQQQAVLVKEDRAKCLPCHQNEAPIFHPPNWPETNAVSGFTRQQLASQHGGGKYWGVPIHVDPNVGGRFQSLVEQATDELALQAVCRDFVCAGDAACRYEYLRSVLLVRNAWSRDEKFEGVVERARVGRAILERWPSDRKPTRISPLLKISVNGAIGDAFGPAITTQGPVKESDVLATLALDPKAPRSPKVMSAWDYAGQPVTDALADTLGYMLIGQGTGFACLGFSAFDDKLLSGYELGTLREALDKPEFRDFVLAKPAAAPKEIMQQLLRALGMPASDIPSRYVIADLAGSDGQAPAVDYATKSVPEILDRFCGACHAGDNPVGGPLPLKDPAALKAFVSPAFGNTVKEMLADDVMPPLSKKARQQVGFSDAVKQKLIEAL